jgi:hypothetical protein
MPKDYQVHECTYCHRVRVIAAKGWCRTCYSRWQRYGRVEKIRVRKQCNVKDCDRVVVSHGFCEKHWDRVVATGDPNRTLRPEDWGQRHKHPLRYVWYLARKDSGVDKRWDHFWTFVADVGDRPGTRFVLRKIREDAPLGPTNFRWCEPDLSKKDHAVYMREHRKRNPDKFRNIDLKKKFGITLEQYETMLNEQNGVCAICKRSDNVMDWRTGKQRHLAVDHCHRSGHIRKLLCQNCNQGLGNFRDDAVLLRAAADYLEG